MYKHDENGKPIEIKKVDWQITRLGHPGTDIAHFLFTSTNPQTLRNHLDELVNHYYDVLSSAMNKLGLGNYDRHLFLLEVKDRFRFGFFMALAVMSGTLDTSAVQAMEKKDAEKVVKDTEYKPEEMIEEFKNVIDCEKILASNTVLRQRILDLVEGAKEALQPKYKTFNRFN